MPDEPSVPLLAAELRDTIGRVVRRLRAEPGPSPGRLAILMRLDRDGPASVSDLAAGEHMRPQSMAQAVNDMEHAGLVSRRPDPDDRRRAFVELTPDGAELLRETRATRETWLTGILDGELDPPEREQLRRALELLRRIADA